MGREHIETLSVRLEFSQIVELFDTLLVLLQLEANDATPAVAHTENPTRAVKGHGGEQVVLGDCCRVRLAQLLHRH